MKIAPLITILLLLPQLAHAAAAAKKAKGAKARPAIAGDSLPIAVEYRKTGQETDAEAEKLGDEEVENSNPCVLQMRRDLNSFESTAELADAVKASKQMFPDSETNPRLVLHYMNEAMEIRFELWTPPIKGQGGIIEDPGHLEFRRGIVLSDIPGTWKDRVDSGRCHVTERKFLEFIGEIREADRLAFCQSRKKDILVLSDKISNYIHNYLPVPWLDQARRTLARQKEPVGDLLRADNSVYREGDKTFRQCQKGLTLLEEEAASSVRVLNEVGAERKGTDLPSQQITDLERLLSGLPAGR